MEVKTKFIIGTALVASIYGAYNFLASKGKTETEHLHNLISLYSSKNILAISPHLTKNSSVIDELSSACELKFGVEPSSTFKDVIQLKNDILLQYRITELTENAEASKEFAIKCNKIAYTPDSLGRLRIKTIKIIKTERQETGHIIYDFEATTFSGTTLKLTADTVFSNNVMKLSGISDTESTTGIEEYTENEVADTKKQ